MDNHADADTMDHHNHADTDTAMTDAADSHPFETHKTPDTQHTHSTSKEESTTAAATTTIEQLLTRFPNTASLLKQTLPGAHVTILFQHFKITVYKFTNKENEHHGLQYKPGRIVDIKPFNSKASCNSGCYAAYSKQYARFWNYKTKTKEQFENYWCYPVSFDPNSQVYFESAHKLKTDIIVLGQPTPIKEMKEFWSDPAQVFANLKENGQNIRQAPWHSDLLFAHLEHIDQLEPRHLQGAPTEVIMKAIELNPNIFQHLDNPSLDIKRFAVMCRGLSLKYVKDADESLEVLATQSDALAIQFVKQPKQTLIYHSLTSDMENTIEGLILGQHHSLINVEFLQTCAAISQKHKYNEELDKLVLNPYFTHKVAEHLTQPVLEYLINRQPKAIIRWFDLAIKNRIWYHLPQNVFENVMNIPDTEQYHTDIFDLLTSDNGQGIATLNQAMKRKIIAIEPERVEEFQSDSQDDQELWEIAIANNASLIRDLPETYDFEKFMWIALKKDVLLATNASLSFESKATREMIDYAISKHPRLVTNKRILHVTNDQLLQAVQQDPQIINTLIAQGRDTPEIKLEAFKYMTSTHNMLSLYTACDINQNQELKRNLIKVNPSNVLIYSETLELDEKDEMDITDALIAQGYQSCISCVNTASPQFHAFISFDICKARILSAFPEFILSQAVIFSTQEQEAAILAKPTLMQQLARVVHGDAPIWTIAIKQDPMNIQFHPSYSPAEELQIQAVSINPKAIECIKIPCASCILVVLHHPDTDESCKARIRKDHENSNMIEKLEELCSTIGRNQTIGHKRKCSSTTLTENEEEQKSKVDESDSRATKKNKPDQASSS